jgi:hypothetical protein
MTREELRRAYANAFIKLVMDHAAAAAAAGVDVSATEERTIVINALRDSIAFFSNPDHWSETE